MIVTQDVAKSYENPSISFESLHAGHGGFHFSASPCTQFERELHPVPD